MTTLMNHLFVFSPGQGNEGNVSQRQHRRIFHVVSGHSTEGGFMVFGHVGVSEGVMLHHAGVFKRIYPLCSLTGLV